MSTTYYSKRMPISEVLGFLDYMGKRHHAGSTSDVTLAMHLAKIAPEKLVAYRAAMRMKYLGGRYTWNSAYERWEFEV